MDEDEFGRLFEGITAHIGKCYSQVLLDEVRAEFWQMVNGNRDGEQQEARSMTMSSNSTADLVLPDRVGEGHVPAWRIALCGHVLQVDLFLETGEFALDLAKPNFANREVFPIRFGDLDEICNQRARVEQCRDEVDIGKIVERWLVQCRSETMKLVLGSGKYGSPFSALLPSAAMHIASWAAAKSPSNERYRSLRNFRSLDQGAQIAIAMAIKDPIAWIHEAHSDWVMHGHPSRSKQ